MRHVQTLAEEIARDRFRQARALFLARHARPPFLLWAPTAGDLPAPELVRLLTWWTSLPTTNGLPTAELLDPGRLAAAGEALLVVEPVGQSGEVVVCREAGQRLIQVLGANRPACDPADHTALFEAAVYRAVLMRREPLYTAHEPASDLVSQADRLILPFAARDGGVARMVVGYVPEVPLRNLAESVMDAVLVFDETGRVRLANRHAAVLFGQDERGGLVGRALADLLRAGFITAGLRAGARLVTPAREATARRADGTELPVEVSVGERRQGRRRLFVAVLRDISARKAEEGRYRQLALTDPLTGLANRVLFQDRFAQAIKRARRGRGRLALFLLDLDKLKTVNDRFGHLVGDGALQEFARRLRTVVRDSDILARLGGDEFALVQSDLGAERGVEALAKRLLTVLAEPFAPTGEPFTLSASLGIAVYPEDGDSIARLTEHADRALYQAKNQGGARATFFRYLGS